MGRSPLQIMGGGTSYFTGQSSTPQPNDSSQNVTQTGSAAQLSAGGSKGPNRVLPTFDGTVDVDLFFINLSIVLNLLFGLRVIHLQLTHRPIAV